jgi:hypothetical protein
MMHDIFEMINQYQLWSCCSPQFEISKSYFYCGGIARPLQQLSPMVNNKSDKNFDSLLLPNRIGRKFLSLAKENF